MSDRVTSNAKLYGMPSHQRLSYNPRTGQCTPSLIDWTKSMTLFMEAIFGATASDIFRNRMLPRCMRSDEYVPTPGLPEDNDPVSAKAREIDYQEWRSERRSYILSKAQMVSTYMTGTLGQSSLDRIKDTREADMDKAIADSDPLQVHKIVWDCHQYRGKTFKVADQQRVQREFTQYDYMGSESLPSLKRRLTELVEKMKNYEVKPTDFQIMYTFLMAAAKYPNTHVQDICVGYLKDVDDDTKFPEDLNEVFEEMIAVTDVVNQVTNRHRSRNSHEGSVHQTALRNAIRGQQDKRQKGFEKKSFQEKGKVNSAYSNINKSVKKKLETQTLSGKPKNPHSDQRARDMMKADPTLSYRDALNKFETCPYCKHRWHDKRDCRDPRAPHNGGKPNHSSNSGQKKPAKTFRKKFKKGRVNNTNGSRDQRDDFNDGDDEGWVGSVFAIKGNQPYSHIYFHGAEPISIQSLNKSNNVMFEPGWNVKMPASDVKDADSSNSEYESSDNSDNIFLPRVVFDDESDLENYLSSHVREYDTFDDPSVNSIEYFNDDMQHRALVLEHLRKFTDVNSDEAEFILENGLSEDIDDYIKPLDTSVQLPIACDVVIDSDSDMPDLVSNSDTESSYQLDDDNDSDVEEIETFGASFAAFTIDNEDKKNESSNSSNLNVNENDNINLPEDPESVKREIDTWVEELMRVTGRVSVNLFLSREPSSLTLSFREFAATRDPNRLDSFEMHSKDNHGVKVIIGKNPYEFFSRMHQQGVSRSDVISLIQGLFDYLDGRIVQNGITQDVIDTFDEQWTNFDTAVDFRVLDLQGFMHCPSQLEVFPSEFPIFHRKFNSYLHERNLDGDRSGRSWIKTICGMTTAVLRYNSQDMYGSNNTMVTFSAMIDTDKCSTGMRCGYAFGRMVIHVFTVNGVSHISDEIDVTRDLFDRTFQGQISPTEADEVIMDCVHDFTFSSCSYHGDTKCEILFQSADGATNPMGLTPNGDTFYTKDELTDMAKKDYEIQSDVIGEDITQETRGRSVRARYDHGNVRIYPSIAMTAGLYYYNIVEVDVDENLHLNEKGEDDRRPIFILSKIYESPPHEYLTSYKVPDLHKTIERRKDGSSTVVITKGNGKEHSIPNYSRYVYMQNKEGYVHWYVVQKVKARIRITGVPGLFYMSVCNNLYDHVLKYDHFHTPALAAQYHGSVLMNANRYEPLLNKKLPVAPPHVIENQLDLLNSMRIPGVPSTMYGVSWIFNNDGMWVIDTIDPPRPAIVLGNRWRRYDRTLPLQITDRISILPDNETHWRKILIARDIDKSPMGILNWKRIVKEFEQWFDRLLKEENNMDEIICGPEDMENIRGLSVEFENVNLRDTPPHIRLDRDPSQEDEDLKKMYHVYLPSYIENRLKSLTTDPDENVTENRDCYFTIILENISGHEIAFYNSELTREDYCARYQKVIFENRGSPPPWLYTPSTTYRQQVGSIHPEPEELLSTVFCAINKNGIPDNIKAESDSKHDHPHPPPPPSGSVGSVPIRPIDRRTRKLLENDQVFQEWEEIMVMNDIDHLGRRMVQKVETVYRVKGKTHRKFVEKMVPPIRNTRETLYRDKYDPVDVVEIHHAGGFIEASLGLNFKSHRIQNLVGAKAGMKRFTWSNGDTLEYYEGIPPGCLCCNDMNLKSEDYEHIQGPEHNRSGVYLASKGKNYPSKRFDNNKWLAIDTMANINVFRNEDLVNDARDSSIPMNIDGVGEKGTKTYRRGVHPLFGDVWIVPSNQYNIVSAFQAQKNGFKLRMSEDNESCWLVNSEKNVSVYFERDPSDHFYKSEIDAETVRSKAFPMSAVENTYRSENQSMYYTQEQLRKAEIVEGLHVALEHPSDQQLTAFLQSPSSINMPVSVQDLHNLRAIKGPCNVCLEGRPKPNVGKHPGYDPNAEATQPGEELHCDIVFVQRNPRLFTVDHVTGYMTFTIMPSKIASDVLSAFETVINAYRSYLRVVRYVSCDHEGVLKALESDLGKMGVRMKVRIPHEHEKRAERAMRVVRERMRVKLRELPYKLPKKLYDSLASECIRNINMMPNYKSLPHSPVELVKGDKTNFLTDIAPPFGSLVLCPTHGEQHKTGTEAKQEIAIVLGPAGSNVRGGISVYIPGRDRPVIRRNVQPLAMTTSVIDHMNKWAEQLPGFEDSEFVFKDTIAMEATRSEDFNLDVQVNPLTSIVPANDNAEYDRMMETDFDGGVITEPQYGLQVYNNTEPEQQLTPTLIEMSYKIDPKEVTADNIVRDSVQINDKPMTTPPVSPMKNPMRPSSDHLKKKGSREKHIDTSAIIETTEKRYSTRSSKQSNPKVYQMSLRKAIQSEAGDAAVEAAKKELKQLVDLKTWIYIRDRSKASPSVHTRVTPCSMFLKQKYNSRGEFLLWKARLVDGGHRTDPTKYNPFEKSSPTSSLEAVYILLSMCVNENMELESFDVPGAYLNASLEPGKFHMMSIDKFITKLLVTVDPSARNFVQPDGSVLVEIRRSLYGLPEASKLWYDYFTKALTLGGYTICPHDPCLFIRKRGSEVSIIALYVDDCLHIWKGMNIYRELYASLRNAKLPDLKVDKLEGNKPVSFLGLNILRKPDRTLEVNQVGYLKNLLEEHGSFKSFPATPCTEQLFKLTDVLENAGEVVESTPFASKLMKTRYCERTRPELSLPLAVLQTKMRNPNEQDEHLLDRTIAYLEGTKEKSMIIRKCDMKLHAYMDSAFAVHGNRVSHSGILFTLGKYGNSILWKSLKQKTVATSSTEAELIGIFDGLDYLIWTRNVLEFLGYKQGTTTIFQDNTSTITMAYMGRGSSGSRTRHIDIKYFYIKQFLDSKDLEIDHLGRENMVADFFASPRQGSVFRRFRGIIMGEIN